MKLKLDENLGPRARQVLRSAGHEAQTVADQGLQGCSDQELYDACCSEGYCLVTLDLDFADVLRFPPRQTGGIVVLRPSGRTTLPLLANLLAQLVQAMHQMPIGNSLWIVEIGRIRVYESEPADEP